MVSLTSWPVVLDLSACLSINQQRENLQHSGSEKRAEKSDFFGPETNSILIFWHYSCIIRGFAQPGRQSIVTQAYPSCTFTVFPGCRRDPDPEASCGEPAGQCHSQWISTINCRATQADPSGMSLLLLASDDFNLTQVAACGCLGQIRLK